MPSAWTFAAKDGNGGTAYRCDYRCSDTGAIEFGAVGNDDVVPYASPIATTLANDLPLFDGYSYATTTPARYDGATEPYAPPRRPVMAFVRTASDRYLDLSRIGFSLAIDPQFGVFVRFGPDQDEMIAGRFFSAPAVPGYAYAWQQLVLTVSLRLGNRVRFASGDAKSPRRLFIRHPGFHLWLAHPGAIWELDRSSSSVAEAPALRGAAGASAAAPGVLRDDRAALAQLHALSRVWYLQDHRAATWSLRACGDLPSWTDTVAGEVAFPRLGEVVTTIGYTDRNGASASATVNTPVTGSAYDNVRCVTKWSTDWADLDFVSR